MGCSRTPQPFNNKKALRKEMEDEYAIAEEYVERNSLALADIFYKLMWQKVYEELSMLIRYMSQTEEQEVNPYIAAELVMQRYK